MRTMVTIASIILAVLLVSPQLGHAATWVIMDDGSGDAPDIQAGINAAADGDTIELAPGTFKGPGNFDIDFNGKAVVVISQNGPASTIVDCELNGRGFIFQNSEGSGSVLSGLTITNADGGVGKGGGINCDPGSPMIMNNVITYSLASGGAGIHARNCSPTIQNNILENNTSGTRGGAISLDVSNALVINNIMDGNHAVNGGGAIHIKSGAPTIESNTMANNSSDAEAAGIFFRNGATGTVQYNLIVFGTLGAGLSCSGGGTNPVLTCNDVFNNAGGDLLCGTDGGNNTFADPEFCGIPGSGNYYLQSDSPCTVFNSPCGVLVGARPELCGTVDAEPKTWGAVKAIYE